MLLNILISHHFYKLGFGVMIIMLMMSLTVMALTLLDGSVEDGVDAPLIEAAGHRRRGGRSACLQRLGVDRDMVLMLFSYC